MYFSIIAQKEANPAKNRMTKVRSESSPIKPSDKNPAPASTCLLPVRKLEAEITS